MVKFKQEGCILWFVKIAEQAFPKTQAFVTIAVRKMKRFLFHKHSRTNKMSAMATVKAIIMPPHSPSIIHILITILTSRFPSDNISAFFCFRQSRLRALYLCLSGLFRQTKTQTKRIMPVPRLFCTLSLSDCGFCWQSALSAVQGCFHRVFDFEKIQIIKSKADKSKHGLVLRCNLIEFILNLDFKCSKKSSKSSNLWLLRRFSDMHFNRRLVSV